jgi:hypothetical protein
MAGSERSEDKPPQPGSAKKPLSPAAERALAEAAARRAEMDRKSAERPKESGRKEGLEPTRYGDWENEGIASDF